MPDMQFSRSVLGGVIAGLASGSMGVSPGGILVPVLSLLLPFSEHAIQGISLVVQAPPTTATALSSYTSKRNRISIRKIVLVSTGVVIGGPFGAMASAERQLRWMFVGYLLVLAVVAFIKNSKPPATNSQMRSAETRLPPTLLGIGMVAGFSSGLLGIGGGLAITALSVALLHLSPHEAQALSLAVTALPLTLPAAWVYVCHGPRVPWIDVAAIVAGLALGTWIGALLANRMSPSALKVVFISLLLAMAGYMTIVAARS